MCLINYGDKSLPDLKSTTLSNLKPDFRYLYTNITDKLFTGSAENEFNNHSSLLQKENKTDITLKNSQVENKNKQKPENIIKTDDIISLQLQPDDKIELSEEEQALLAEDERN